MLRACACLALAIVGSQRIAAAQSPASLEARPPVTLSDTHVFTLRDDRSNTTFRVYVALPPGYETTPRRYPTLYILDADAGFALATQAYRLLRADTTMADLLLVGIGYEAAGTARRALRMRDLTPTEMASIPNSGAGRAFLHTLTSRIIPAVDSLYRTDAEDRAIFGHSLGGLFALYALFERPEVFRRYIVSSPSLWWDNAAILGLEQRFSRGRAELPKTVFMSVGSEESKDMHEWFQPLADSLASRRYAGFRMTTTVLPHENHLSVFGSSLVRGIRIVY